MTNIQLQRTLLIGLGEAGEKTTDALLAELTRRLGEVGIMQGVVVVSQEAPSAKVETPLVISPEAIFETWQQDFNTRVETALRRISQLSHLSQLAQQHVRLCRPDEIHLVIIADMGETWIQPAIPPLVATLRDIVERSLACRVGISGVLLYPRSSESEQQIAPASCSTDQFERGCFLAGLTNEVGLIIGDAERLIQATVDFLVVLLLEAPAAGLDREDYNPSGWGNTLTSFGIVTLRWYGDELVKALSARWSHSLLEQMLNLLPGGWQKSDLACCARENVQQWLTGQKLSPLLLLDRLAATMPPPPNHLSAFTPDPPWPWLLLRTQTKLESAACRWQEEWLALSKERLNLVLEVLQTQWPQLAQTWLAQRLAQNRQGVVLLAQSYLAEMSEILQVFVEGVEQRLEEAEVDLADLDQQLGQAAEVLTQALAAFPASPLSALFHWGSHPLRWPYYWTRCRQAQTTARNFAHLSRGRLIAWQMVLYYEELLPFYRQLLTDWRDLVERWKQTCRQVVKASITADLTDWPEQLERCWRDSAIPWSETFITALYHEAVELHTHTIWEKVGSLNDWTAESIEAEVIVSRLLEQTAHYLTPLIKIPVDQALVRQLPDSASYPIENKEAQANWLAGIIEQARPFWRYDETTLDEHFRTQARLETWLLLPGGEASPLAHLAQDLSQPPKLLASRQPQEMAVVTVRRIHWDGPEVKSDQ